jgi:mRNA interferase MazF
VGIQFHPKPGTVVICDFNTGFVAPEMVKRRPCIVVSPQITHRQGLCTVVPISTGRPRIQMPYHVELPGLKLPPPWDEGPNWVKADMIYALAWSRIDLIRKGRNEQGKRIYDRDTLSPEDFMRVRKAILCGLGMANLTKHL